MGTTSLLVEIVIIGFQVLVWISLTVLTICGYKWIDLSSLKDWSAAIAVGLIAVSYTLGLIFDNLVASLFAPWQYRTVREATERGRRFLSREGLAASPLDASPLEMIAYIMATNKDVFEHLERLSNQNRLL